jgi:hypothetical protein
VAMHCWMKAAGWPSCGTSSPASASD